MNCPMVPAAHIDVRQADIAGTKPQPPADRNDPDPFDAALTREDREMLWCFHIASGVDPMSGEGK